MRIDHVATVSTSCPQTLGEATIYFLLLMAFLGATSVSFIALLVQMFTPRGDRRSYHPSKLPKLAVFHHSPSVHLLGIPLQLCTSKSLQN